MKSNSADLTTEGETNRVAVLLNISLIYVFNVKRYLFTFFWFVLYGLSFLGVKNHDLSIEI